MSQSRKQLAQQAMAKALRVRSRCGIDQRAPVCVYDLCEQVGVAVWFSDIPSMEGVYHPKARPKPAIIVSALRPPGRQAMTCGHELGHHEFEHGEQWDELVENRSQSRGSRPEEYQADLFSAELHMPKRAVTYALSKRQIDPCTCTPEALYALSNWFGVGYGTVVTHMAETLGVVDDKRKSELLRYQPKLLRASVLGRDCPQNLIVSDLDWSDRAIDLQVADLAVLPSRAVVEGCCISVIEETSSRTLVEANAPGIGRAFKSDSGWAAFIRVSRKNFVGRAPFRFDEEVDDDVE